MERGESTQRRYALVPFFGENEHWGILFNRFQSVDFAFGFPSSALHWKRSFILHSTQKPAEFWFVLLAEGTDDQQKIFTLLNKGNRGELSVKTGMSNAGFDLDTAKVYA